MRKILLVFAVCVCSAVFAENIVLDLSKPNPEFPIEYDDKGVWSDVYVDGSTIFVQEFMFSHGVLYDGLAFNGFFPSKVTAVSESAGLDDQWGCMAKGGFSGEGTPYLGAYWDAYTESTSDAKTCEVFTSAPYYAVGCYVCNSPYAYYAIEKGNPYSTKFEQGDWFKLVAHGIDEQGTETGTVEYYLADYRSENADDWKLNDTWEWVDLSELGQITSIYFTMESSDVGDYGINTPTYFCLDRLTVSTEPSSVEESVVAQVKVYYDRSNGAVRVESAQLVEAAVYNMSGTLVMKQLVEGSGAIDMSAYPAGVYVVRCGGYSTKIVK